MEGNKRTALFLLGALAATAVGIFCYANFARAADSCDAHIIISQIYGGGGNSGATYENDFVELYNPTTEDAALDDWSIQYAPGSSTNFSATNLTGTIEVGKHYLIQGYASGSAEGQTLPEPVDAIGTTNLSSVAGKVALVRSTAAISSETDPVIADFVNYSAGSNTKSIFRDLGSCPNTFYADAPRPRNRSIVENGEEPQTDEDIPQDEPKKCITLSEDIKLNEIYPYPESGNEFVEITNIGESCVDVSGWKIMDGTGHKKTFPENSTMYPGKYLFLEGNLYLNNDSDTVYLLAADGIAADEALDNIYYEKARKNLSFSFENGNWRWTTVPTSGAENIIRLPESEEKESADTGTEENLSSAEGIYLNEILPSPQADSGEEYIEIVNDESEPVDLYGWTIRDASKTGKYFFKGHERIEPGQFLLIYRSQSKLALNNSGESVYLYNPRGKITSSVSYGNSQINSSYNFDGESWRWSKYLTPGAENKFDSKPTVKIKKIKNAYKNLFVEFSASAKDKETKKLKYAWDFGDGKKSYLAKTSHKYLDTGKYTVTLSVNDESQAVEKSFSLEVTNYPRPDLEIMKIIPNPAGRDTDGEIVDIRNNSAKKIDLRSWKIATGLSKLYSHPISGEISLEPNETKAITTEICKFSLNNKAGKVQLAMPDGKVIDEAEYAKEKISDDEAYVKIDGEWRWFSPNTQNENTNEKNGVSEEPGDKADDETADGGEILGATDENEPVAASRKFGFTSEDAYIFLSQINFARSAEKETNYCSATSPSAIVAYLLASLI